MLQNKKKLLLSYNNINDYETWKVFIYFISQTNFTVIKALHHSALQVPSWVLQSLHDDDGAWSDCFIYLPLLKNIFYVRPRLDMLFMLWHLSLWKHLVLSFSLALVTPTKHSKFTFISEIWRIMASPEVP